MKIALTDDDIESLRNGETVEYSLPGLQQPGRNTTLEIEPLDSEQQLSAYENGFLLVEEFDV